MTDRAVPADAAAPAGHPRAFEIVGAARAWIGTPYRHQAACRGAGADCLGLLRGVWRDLKGREPETPPPYDPGWGLAAGAEDMRDAARRHLVEIAAAARRPGDVLLFRMTPGGPARHCAILASPATMVHAWSGRAVAETSCGPVWLRRLAHVFRFPDDF